MSEKNHHVLLVGIGNEFRKDDGVGCYVVGKIMSRSGGRLAAKVLEREGTNLIECWRGYKIVYVVDAASSGQEPGTVHRFEVPAQSLPKSVFCTSTHALSLADVIHLAQTLDALPPEVIVYGIEAGSFEHGRGLTGKVKVSADKLAEELSGEINSLLNSEGRRA